MSASDFLSSFFMFSCNKYCCAREKKKRRKTFTYVRKKSQADKKEQKKKKRIEMSSTRFVPSNFLR